jgi:hypothetical protein
MKVQYILLFFLLLGCKKEDDTAIDCSFIELAAQNFFIELLSAEGDNLIENGTFKQDEIIVLRDGTTAVNTIFNEVQGSENVITIDLYGTDGDMLFTVDLNETVRDTLVLNLTSSMGAYNYLFYTVNGVTYNNDTIKVQPLSDASNASYKTTVME